MPTNLVYLTIALVSEILKSLFPEKATCKSCSDGGLGYTFDGALLECCDNCVKRSLSMISLGAHSSYGFFSESPTEDKARFLDRLCRRYNLVYSRRLHNLYLEVGHSSNFYPTSDDFDSVFGKSVWKLFQKEDYSLLPASLRKLVPANITKMTATQKRDVFETLYRKASTLQPFLDYDQFFKLFPDLSENNFEILSDLDEDRILLEPVNNVVHRYVSLSSSPSNESRAKGITMSIRQMVMEEMKKEGRIADIANLQLYSDALSDTSTGFVRHTTIDVFRIKDSIFEDPVVYNNLFYSTALHCGGLGCFDGVPLEFRRQDCQVHRVQCDEKADDRGFSPWYSVGTFVPYDWGLKPPSSILNQTPPTLDGQTMAAITGKRLLSSLTGYLVSVAKILNPAVTALSQVVQILLQGKYKSIQNAPQALVKKLLGKSDDAACDIIFSSRESLDPEPKMLHPSEAAPLTVAQQTLDRLEKLEKLITGKAEKKEKKKSKKKDGDDSWKTVDGKTKKKKKKSGKKEDQKKKTKEGKRKWEGYTDKQVSRLESAFGGDFNAFMTVRRENGITTKVDPMKLSNYFVKGKPNFGRKTLDEVVSSSRKNE